MQNKVERLRSIGAATVVGKAPFSNQQNKLYLPLTNDLSDFYHNF